MEALLAEGRWRRFEPMPGRVMREYVVVPPDVVARRDSLRRWLEEALHHVLGLPAKPPRHSGPGAKQRRQPRKGRAR